MTGAELKRQIITAAVNQGYVINDVMSDVGNMKLITSGRVVDDDASLQQQQIRVCYNTVSDVNLPVKYVCGKKIFYRVFTGKI